MERCLGAGVFFFTKYWNKNTPNTGTKLEINLPPYPCHQPNVFVPKGSSLKKITLTVKLALGAYRV